MTDTEQKAAAKKFAADWKGKGYEKGQSQPFWLSLLRDVYGVEHPEQFIFFEEQVRLDNTSFIDATIPSTKVLIEQKGLDKDLNKPIKQSDGTLLTPFQQAKRYITELPLSLHPRWVVTCNFGAFYVYDMERPGGEPEQILLENLPTEYYRLSFLTDSGSEHLKREMEVSLAAGKIVGLLYDLLAKQYVDPSSQRALQSLNVLCVRLVFCLYAEDAGVFGRKMMFHDYLAEFEARHLRKAIIELFQILDTMPSERDPYLDPALAAFPYVNGGLFGRSSMDVEIPQFTDEIRNLLLTHASEDFNWSEISPTIFGAVFESTLNPETRRSGGMHYTSIENIHKVIDPLFLDGLKKEFADICDIAVAKTKTGELRKFQAKLASLSFFDPACGSGNFLTETYVSLRHLENEALNVLRQGQISF
ncbi:MAG: methylase, partial [Lachnospiraceae bacterium]|nr:methylase [Lachnospiraceae bacterium]